MLLVAVVLGLGADASEGLKSRDWETRRAAARDVLASGAKDAAPALKACALDRSVDSTVPCAWAAYRLGGDADSLTQVRAALAAPLNWKRVNAAEDIAAMRDREAGPLLVETSRSWPWQARRAAVDGLAELEDDRATPALVERLWDSSWVVRRAAGLALSRIPRGATAIGPAAREDWGVTTLPRDFEKSRMRRLVALLRDEHPGAQEGALAAMGRWGTRAEHAMVARATRSRDRHVRRGAVVGLAATGNRAYLPAIRARLRDGDFEVSATAARALRGFGEAVPPAWGLHALRAARARDAAERIATVIREVDDGNPEFRLGAALFDGSLERNTKLRAVADDVITALSRAGADSVVKRSLAAALASRNAATKRRANRHAQGTPTVAREPLDDPRTLETHWPLDDLYNLRWQNRYNAEILAAAKDLPGLDPLVLKSLVAQESNFDAWARNDYDCAGLAQFCPYAGREEGVPPSRRKEDFFEDPRYDPAKALRAAVRHLRRKLAVLDRTAFRRFGRPTGDELWAFVLASYNGGEGAVADAMARTFRHGLDLARDRGLAGLEAERFAAAHARRWGNVIGDVDWFVESPLFGMTTEKYYWYRPYGRYAPLAGAAAKYLEIGLFPVEILARRQR